MSDGGKNIDKAADASPSSTTSTTGGQQPTRTAASKLRGFKRIRVADTQQSMIIVGGALVPEGRGSQTDRPAGAVEGAAMADQRKKAALDDTMEPAPPVNWAEVYEDEVAAAANGILFQPGYEPQKGKKLQHVIDLDPPGQPHWLSGLRRQPPPTKK